MKVVLASSDNAIFNLLKSEYEVIHAKNEKFLIDCIKAGDVQAFIIDSVLDYCQKSIKLIKANHKYIPVVSLGLNDISDADIYISNVDYNLIKNINSYNKNFYNLKKLMVTNKEILVFGEYSYDAVKRSILLKNEVVEIFSQKAGGILEILISNLNQVIKKEVILQKIWKKDDYFASRSMDVYISGIRKSFLQNKIPYTIRNISKTGLILETK